jgi:hypothetical protein
LLEPEPLHWAEARPGVETRTAAMIAKAITPAKDCILRLFCMIMYMIKV